MTKTRMKLAIITSGSRGFRGYRWSLTIFDQAATVTISGGETIVIESNKKTTVSCDAPEKSSGNAKENSTGICQAFHGDSECNSAPLGSPFSRDGEKGICVRSGFFAGAVNYRCQK